MESIGMRVAQMEDAVRKSRNAMDASSHSGRVRTAELQKELDRLRDIEKLGKPRVVIAPTVHSPEFKRARERIRKVAKGATINGTYRLSPELALEAFRADLLLLVGDA